MTERPIPAAGDDTLVRRGDTPEAAADAAFIPQPVYARRAERKRKGVPPALYVAPLVGVALLGGLALMTDTGAPETAAPQSATEAARTSDASATALAANTLQEPAADGDVANAPSTADATLEPAPARAVAPPARSAPRPAPTQASTPQAPSATDAGTDVAAELPEAPIPYSATAQSSSPAPMISTTPLDIPPPDAAAPPAEATSEATTEPMTF